MGGINPQLHQRWIVRNVLTNTAPTLVEEPPSGPESKDPWNFKGGSDNMTILYSACWYAWAYLVGSQDLPIHRRRCAERMDKEALCHGLREPLSPSHLQLWLAAVALILWTAERDEGGEGLLLAARSWFAVEYQTWIITDTGAAGPFTPGGRAYLGGKKKGKPPIGFNSARSMALRVVRYGFRKKRPDQYNTGPILLGLASRESLDAIRKGVTQLPPFWGGCYLARWEDDAFLVSFGADMNDVDGVRGGGRLHGLLWLDVDGVTRERQEAYLAKGAPMIQLTAPSATPPGANKES